MAARNDPTRPGNLEKAASPPAEDLETVKNEVLGRVKELLDELFQKDPKVISQIVRIRESFSGPLPPPNHFGQYEQILPGSANRILAMAESETEHRQAIESQLVAIQKRGQDYGFLIGIAAIIAGVVLVLTGSSVSGVMLMFLAIGTLVSSFIIDRFLAKKGE